MRTIDYRPSVDKVQSRLKRDFHGGAKSLATRDVANIREGLHGRYRVIGVGAFQEDRIVAFYTLRRDGRVEGFKIHPESDWVQPGKHWVIYDSAATPIGHGQ